MEQYIYKVGNKEFVATEAFGEVYRNQVKPYAISTQQPIYRTIIRMKQDVLCKGNVFLSVGYAKPENIEEFKVDA